MVIIHKYNKDHAWQYDIRLNTLEEDKEELSLSDEDLSKLRVADFEFRAGNKADFQDIKEFIIKYEWLGTLPPYPTHYFIATYKGVLAGVLIYTMPNAFSKLLGDQTKDLERLLARGACASWTPKNLASAFISWSVNWMVDNTQYRVFTAYSDPMARELGTVYQACNWNYLGQTSGSTYRYKEPGSSKWVSDRKFRNLASYKKYAGEMGVDWDPSWSTKRKVHWENMPEGLEERLRDEGKRRQAECERMKVPPKHKYAMIKGRDKRETKQLLQIFKQLNPKLVDLAYPKERGV